MGARSREQGTGERVEGRRIGDRGRETGTGVRGRGWGKCFIGGVNGIVLERVRV